ncbi:MAG: hypothetical protein J7513_10275 [Solirubrobacteraceae bacterium]|nr:hypothetical protein [Solirubrobacteraceae bacterium]
MAATHLLDPTHPRATQRLLALFAVAALVSVVHYVDNVANYSDYPLSGTLPDPSAALIAVAWFAFTALGIAGVLEFRRRGPTPRAALLLGGYSGSGLIGILHYSAAGATSMPWWRQLHIVADIVCGLLIFAFALAIARSQTSASTVSR